MVTTYPGLTVAIMPVALRVDLFDWEELPRVLGGIPRPVINDWCPIAEVLSQAYMFDPFHTVGQLQQAQVEHRLTCPQCSTALRNQN